MEVRLEKSVRKYSLFKVETWRELWCTRRNCESVDRASLVMIESWCEVLNVIE